MAKNGSKNGQPEFTVEFLSPAELRAHPENFRRHPQNQRRALAQSIEEHGWLSAPIWNRRTQHILDGHARVEQAQASKEPTIPVRVVDVPEWQERRILRQFDAITALATEDEEALQSLIAGIADPELEALLAGVEEESGGGLLPDADPDEIPEEVETRCRLGDLWELGGSRLAIGNCTDAEVVQRLMGGERAKLMVTDPPYAVDYVSKARDMNRRGYVHSRATLGAAIAGDEIEAGQEDVLWREAFTVALADALGAGSGIYAWHAGNRAKRKFLNLLQELGLLHHQTIIWSKPNFVIGRCDYQAKHEECWYGWVEGSRPPFYGEKNQTTIWEVSRDTQHPDHPTQKPVALFTPCFRNHLKPGELAYDPFVGSGTVFIAAEEAGCRAYGCEIRPAYGDVSLARWERATGREAHRIES